jgi:hypothetical protein
MRNEPGQIFFGGLPLGTLLDASRAAVPQRISARCARSRCDTRSHSVLFPQIPRIPRLLL